MFETQKDRDQAAVKPTPVTVEILLPRLNQQSHMTVVLPQGCVLLREKARQQREQRAP